MPTETNISMPLLGQTPFGPMGALITDNGLAASWFVQEAPAVALDLWAYPLDVKGSPFVMRVWDACAQIPWGTVVTYGALAHTLDTHPRAVAMALSKNLVAARIPCHRVVGQNGSGGFRWGVDRKRLLLDLEQMEK